MTFSAIGDLAKGYALRSRNSVLQKQLERLSNEMTTGRTSDPVERLGGHLSYLSQIEHDLARHSSFSTGAQELAISAAAMQQSLERVGSVSDGVVESLALVVSAGGSTDLATVASEARGALESTVSALNTQAGGRHLFAGVATDTAPLASATELLAALRTEIAGETTVSGVISAMDTFFDGPDAGFETLIYQGSNTGIAAVSLGNGEAAQLDLKANHPAFRATLRNLALVGLADDPALSLDEESRRSLLDAALEGLLTAKSQQVTVRADLGFAQERIEQAKTRLETEVSSLELARNRLLAIDPYDVATELEASRNQLETLYTVTARLSNLNLVSFLS